MLIKKIKLVATLLVAAFLLNGCDNLKPPSQEVIKKNNGIKVFIDESASDVRARRFMNYYLKTLNDLPLSNSNYILTECTLKKTVTSWQRGTDVTTKGNFLSCTRNELSENEKGISINIEATQITPNKIEIKTDGSLNDIQTKRIFIYELEKNKEYIKKLLPYGYTSFIVDGEALGEGRLVLDFYPEYMKIKKMYEETLAERGFQIVDNYDDADRVLFIENLAAIPQYLSGGLYGYFRKNGEEILENEIKNIKEATINYTNLHGNHDTASEIGRVSTLYATNNSMAGLQAGAMVAGLALKLLSGESKRKNTYIAYKLIIENKNFDSSKYDDVEQYRYRAAIYSFPMPFTANVPSIVHERLYTVGDGFVDVKSDLINYFESDSVTRKNEIRKADYDDINE